MTAPLDSPKRHHVTQIEPDLSVESPVLQHLNEYQIASLQHMVKLETGAKFHETFQKSTGRQLIHVFTTILGCLANRVGTGKTRVALALALSEHFPNSLMRTQLPDLMHLPCSIQRFMAGSLDYRASATACNANPIALAHHSIHEEEEHSKDTIIIVQSHLAHQWRAELALLGYDESMLEEMAPGVERLRLPTHNVYLMSISMEPSSHHRYLAARRPYYEMRSAQVIYDEVGSVNAHMHSVKMRRSFTWLVSATPRQLKSMKYPFHVGKDFTRELVQYVYEVYSHEGNAWNLAHIPYTVECSPEFIDEIISLPEVEMKTHTVRRSRLRQMMKDAPLLLPGTAKDYLKELEIDARRLMDAQRANTSEERKQAAKAKIKRLQEQINMVDKLEGECAICLQTPPEDPVLTECCSHSFCMYCLVRCPGSVCPYCRAEDLRYRKVNGESAPEVPRLKSRDQVVISLIQPGKSYLVIGDTGRISGLKNLLQVNNITSHYMDKFDDSVARHRREEFQCLIFDCRDFGAGLDMTYCDEIIIYSELNRCNYTQVTGRLCRLGRTRPVIVHKFAEEDDH